MELTILSKTEESLLKRERFKANITFEQKTPSEAEVKQQLAKKVGGEEALIAVKSIQGMFGQRSVAVDAYLYAQKEAFDLFEKKKEKKAKVKKEKPKK